MNFNGKVNVYEEIVFEFKRLISIGAIGEGEKLPSVRTYAIERKVNPNTVAKAYSFLEEEGVIKILPKKGAYVVGLKGETDNVERLKKLIQAEKQAGVSKQTWLDLIETVYKKGEGND
jgi:GntR family transcriptional regulator